jgi:hypothetical protein
MCRAISSELAPMAIILPHAPTDLSPLYIARALLYQYSFFRELTGAEHGMRAP